MVKSCCVMPVVLAFDAHIFCFGEKAQCFPAAFSANTRVFYTAKWRPQIANKPTVYPNNTALYLISKLMSAAEGWSVSLQRAGREVMMSSPELVPWLSQPQW